MCAHQTDGLNVQLPTRHIFARIVFCGNLPGAVLSPLLRLGEPAKSSCWHRCARSFARRDVFQREM